MYIYIFIYIYIYIYIYVYTHNICMYTFTECQWSLSWNPPGLNAKPLPQSYSPHIAGGINLHLKSLYR